MFLFCSSVVTHLQFSADGRSGLQQLVTLSHCHHPNHSIPNIHRYPATRSGRIFQSNVYASCASPTFQKYGAHINQNTHETPHMIVAAIAINSGIERITTIQNHTSIPLSRVAKAIIPAKRNKINPVSNKGATHHHNSVMAVTVHLRSAVGAVGRSLTEIKTTANRTFSPCTAQETVLV